MAGVRGLGSAAALAVLIFAAGVAGGCSSSSVPVQSGAQSHLPTMSSEEQPGSDAGDMLPLSIPGAPFEVEVRSLSTSDVVVANAAEQTEPSSSHALAPLGHTSLGDAGLPGPSVRTILDADSALAGLLQPMTDGEITDLAQVPTTLGTLDSHGVFVANDLLTDAVAELPGSNPDGLYFEPQDASAGEGWVLWREGSAGEKGALPTLDEDDWRVVAWDTQRGTVTEYASGFLLHGDRHAPRLSWTGAPTTDGQYVYFAAAVPTQVLGEALGEGWGEGILRIPLDSPGAVEVIGAGSAPAADPNGGAYWVAEGRSLVRDDGPVLSVVTDGWLVSGVVATSVKFFVSVVGEEGEDAWILMGDATTLALEAAIRSTSDWVTMDAYGDTVVWGNGTANSDPAMYLWRNGDEAAQLLGSAQGMSVPRIGSTLVAVPQISSEGGVIWQFLRSQ